MPVKFVCLMGILCLLPNRVQAQLDDYDKSKIVGHKEDARHVGYEAASTKKAPLVGFEFGIGTKVGSTKYVPAVRPIFLGETTDRATIGRFQDGTANGKAMKTAVQTKEKVVAKDGYAVSKVVLRCAIGIDSIQVHFAKIKGDGLDLKDTYSANYYGAAEAKGTFTTLDGEGRLIVGVTGTMDDVKATGFGLTYAGKLPPKPQPQPEDRTAKATPNGGTVTLPGFDTPNTPAPKPAPTPAPAPKPAPKAAPPREIDPDVKARIEKQNEEIKARIEKQNAEAKKQHDQLFADAKKQQAAVNQAFANVPNWDATPHDQEAAKEFWRKALDIAEADPNLTDAKRAEIAQFRKALGLEKGPSGWAILAIGFTVICLGGTIAMVVIQYLRGPRPHADGNAEDTPSDNKVGSDIPEQYLRPILHELTESEQLLWTGLQSPRVLWKGGMIGTAAAGGMAVAFGLFSLIPLLGRSSPATIPGIVMLVFGVAAAGFSLFVFLNAKRSDKHTVYALTNRRALVCRPTLFGEGHVDSYGPQVLQGMRRRDYWFTKGAGDLIFRTERTLHVHVQSNRNGSSASTSESERRFGFLGIDNVREVEKLVREKLVNPLVDKLLV